MRETPYSANIVLRKSFVKTLKTPWPTSSLSSKPEVQNSENAIENLEHEIFALKDALVKSQANLKTSKESCGVLEQKIDIIEASALKTYEEKKSEETTNKMVKYSDEIHSLKKDLNDSKKLIKIKMCYYSETKKGLLIV